MLSALGIDHGPLRNDGAAETAKAGRLARFGAVARGGKSRIRKGGAPAADGTEVRRDQADRRHPLPQRGAREWPLPLSRRQDAQGAQLTQGAAAGTRCADREAGEEGKGSFAPAAGSSPEARQDDPGRAGTLPRLAQEPRCRLRDRPGTRETQPRSPSPPAARDGAQRAGEAEALAQRIAELEAERVRLARDREPPQKFPTEEGITPMTTKRETPANVQEITTRLRDELVPVALDTLFEIMHIRKAPAPARVQAAKAVLDRGFPDRDGAQKELRERSAAELSAMIDQLEGIKAERAKTIDDSAEGAEIVPPSVLN